MWQKLSIQFRNFHHNLLIISTTLHTMQHTHTGLCMVDSDIVIICDLNDKKIHLDMTKPIHFRKRHKNTFKSC